MPRNSPFSNASVNEQPVSGISTSRTTFTSLGCLSPTASNYGPPNPSAMSAAAAAAFLLQAASGGSINGDSSSGTNPARRSSASAFIESCQSSPPFSSSVISAAAHQAALAAAHAIGSSQSSSKASSDLQAAVISLALAANPPGTNQAHTYLYDQNDKALRPNQSVTDFFLLSERHSDLLTSHPTLASVFRRRSSTVLPAYLSDTPEADSVESLDKRILPSDANSSQNLISAFELLNSRQRPNFSNLLESSVSPSAGSHHVNLRTDVDSNPRDDCLRTADSCRIGMDTSFPKFGPAYPSICESSKVFVPATTCDIARSYTSHVGSHGSVIRNPVPFGNQCLSSPASTSIVNEHCRSTSPLSYSSSNAPTPGLNISPLPSDDRLRTVLDATSSDMAMKFNLPHKSTRVGLEDIKSDYSLLWDYKDEPNRKREQRLIKNREAARECRRKKKEYVKCLESRVSLLESQNQQLIEELQKVKALCFNELCGFGMNNSTAVCAAAVLAAATSMSGSCSVSGPAFTSANSNCPLQPGLHLFEKNVFNPSGSENPYQMSPQPTLTPRTRARRRSTARSSKLPELSVPGSDGSQFPYTDQYPNKLDCDDECSHSFMSDVTHKSGSSQPLRIDSSGSTNFYDTVISSGGGDSGIDVVEPRTDTQGSSGTSQTFSDLQLEGTKHPDLRANYVLRSETPSEVSHSSNCFAHPHYSTKRPYRHVQADEQGWNTEIMQSTNLDHTNGTKSTRASGPVTDAAVILAAAAAMVAESDLKTEIH